MGSARALSDPDREPPISGAEPDPRALAARLGFMRVSKPYRALVDAKSHRSERAVTSTIG
jgi:hypothetical protein